MPRKTAQQYFCRHIFFPHLVYLNKLILIKLFNNAVKTALEFFCNETDASHNYKSHFSFTYWHCYYTDIIPSKHAVAPAGPGTAKNFAGNN